MRILIAVLLAVFVLTTGAYAASEAIGQGMVDKAYNGIVNLFTGVLEIPAQMCKGWEKGLDPINKESPKAILGGAFGFFRGIAHAAGRTTWGVFELATFWAANPKDNVGVGIPLDSKYSWEAGEQYCITKPTLGDGVVPVGRKFVNGFTDALTGMVEWPVQTTKGNPLVGFCRGLWFAVSRELNGVANMATFLLPNPTETYGYGYHTKWPWTPEEQKTK